jgi:hypothetical protein
MPWPRRTRQSSSSPARERSRAGLFLLRAWRRAKVRVCREGVPPSPHLSLPREPSRRIFAPKRRPVHAASDRSRAACSSSTCLLRPLAPKGRRAVATGGAAARRSPPTRSTWNACSFSVRPGRGGGSPSNQPRGVVVLRSTRRVALLCRCRESSCPSSPGTLCCWLSRGQCREGLHPSRAPHPANPPATHRCVFPRGCHTALRFSVPGFTGAASNASHVRVR